MNKKIKKYGNGGQIADLLIGGLSTGLNMVAPGVGTLAGMAGNFIKDTIDNKNEKNKRENFERNNLYGSTPTGGYKIPSFSQGGTTHEFGQGLSKMNNLKEYIGPRHERGGIIEKSKDGLIEVEGGETRLNDYIFSDRLMDPGTGKTFAEKSKGIKNKYKRNKDWLKAKTEGFEYKRNQIKNDATKMVAEGMRKKLAATGKQMMMAEMQQQMMQQGGVPKMADGGPIQPPMMFDFNEYLESNFPVLNSNIDDSLFNRFSAAQGDPGDRLMYNLAKPISNLYDEVDSDIALEKEYNKLSPNMARKMLGWKESDGIADSGFFSNYKPASDSKLPEKAVKDLEKKVGKNGFFLYDDEKLGADYVFFKTDPSDKKHKVYNIKTGKISDNNSGGEKNIASYKKAQGKRSIDLYHRFGKMTKPAEKTITPRKTRVSPLDANGGTIPDQNRERILSPQQKAQDFLSSIEGPLSKANQNQMLSGMNDIFDRVDPQTANNLATDIGDGSSTIGRSSDLAFTPDGKSLIADGANPDGTSADGTNNTGIGAQLKNLFNAGFDEEKRLSQGDRMQIAGSMIAPLYNLSAYALSKPEIERPEVNPYGAMAVNNQLNLRARGNYDPLMAQMNSARSNINQNTSGAMRIAGNVSNMTQGARAINSQATQLANLNAGYRQQGNNMAQQLGEYDRRESVRAEIATDQNKAARNEFLRRGIEQMGTSLANTGTAINSNEQQIQMQNILGDMYKYYKIGDDGTIEFDQAAAKKSQSTSAGAKTTNSTTSSTDIQAPASVNIQTPAPDLFERVQLRGFQNLTPLENYGFGEGVDFSVKFNNILDQ